VSVNSNTQWKANAKPDLALINIGVLTQANTAGQALSANSKSMDALMKTLSGHGIEDRDVQTSNFSISPNYDYTNNKPKIVGYSVNNIQALLRMQNAKHLFTQPAAVYN
jgi:uncharacterized protein YggE